MKKNVEYIVNRIMPGRTENEFNAIALRRSKNEEWNRIAPKRTKKNQKERRLEIIIECTCGGYYSKKHKQRHLRTKRRLRHIENTEIVYEAPKILKENAPYTEWKLWWLA